MAFIIKIKLSSLKSSGVGGIKSWAVNTNSHIGIVLINLYGFLRFPIITTCDSIRNMMWPKPMITDQLHDQRKATSAT